MCICFSFCFICCCCCFIQLNSRFGEWIDALYGIAGNVNGNQFAVEYNEGRRISRSSRKKIRFKIRSRTVAGLGIDIFFKLWRQLFSVNHSKYPKTYKTISSLFNAYFVLHFDISLALQLYTNCSQFFFHTTHSLTLSLFIILIQFTVIWLCDHTWNVKKRTPENKLSHVTHESRQCTLNIQMKYIRNNFVLAFGWFHCFSLVPTDCCLWWKWSHF